MMAGFGQQLMNVLLLKQLHVACVRAVPAVPRLYSNLTSCRRFSSDSEQEMPKTTSSLEGDGQTHLDYDLDQLLENIRSARSNTSAVDNEVSGRMEASRHTQLSIEELVAFLREERGEDMAVIQVPPERGYVKYFVTCVGLGSSHIQRMAHNLATQVKGVRDESGQRCPVIVEGRDSEDWVVVQTGDSVVHLLTREARERYQLEQLWTLGHHYDDQYQNMERISLESDALK